MILSFNTQAQLENWLDGTILKSGVIAFVAETELYYFTTNNIDGTITTYNANYAGVISGENIPKSIKEQVYSHYNKLHPKPVAEYATKTDLFDLGEEFNSKLDVEVIKIEDEIAVTKEELTDNIDNLNEVLTGHLERSDAEFKALKEKVEDLALFKFPNVTIVGQPTVNNGQIGNFGVNNYLQFPFLVDFHGQTFSIDMCFTTGDQVTSQENILDSHFGLAFAIRNGKFVLALSSDGESWDIGEYTGSLTVIPNTTYYTKLSFDGTAYKLDVSTDKETYTTDITITSTASLFPKQMIIGKCNDDSFVFSGIVNLNYCYLYIHGKEVWQGMDSVGIATRLQTDLGNLDAAGEAKIKELVGGASTNAMFAYETKTSAFNVYLYKDGAQVTDWSTLGDDWSYTIDWVDKTGTMTKEYMKADCNTVRGNKLAVNYVTDGIGLVKSVQFRCTLTVGGKIIVRDIYSPALAFNHKTEALTFTLGDGTTKTLNIYVSE